MYHSDLPVSCLKEISVADCVTYFLVEGLPASEILGQVDCMGARNFASAHTGLTNVVSSVLRISIDEFDYRNDSMESYRSRILPQSE